MKNDITKRTLWTFFIELPTEEEIQESANKMKNGKAYLFKDRDGSLYILNKRRPNEYEERFFGYIFVRKIVPTT